MMGQDKIMVFDTVYLCLICDGLPDDNQNVFSDQHVVYQYKCCDGKKCWLQLQRRSSDIKSLSHVRFRAFWISEPGVDPCLQQEYLRCPCFSL